MQNARQAELLDLPADADDDTRVARLNAATEIARLLTGSFEMARQIMDLDCALGDAVLLKNADGVAN